MKKNIKKWWPSNKEVKEFKFNISKIDNMKDFDYYARANLIKKEISVKDYLLIEKTRKQVILNNNKISRKSRHLLAEVLDSTIG